MKFGPLIWASSENYPSIFINSRPLHWVLMWILLMILPGLYIYDNDLWSWIKFISVLNSLITYINPGKLGSIHFAKGINASNTVFP